MFHLTITIESLEELAGFIAVVRGDLDHDKIAALLAKLKTSNEHLADALADTSADGPRATT